MSPAQDKCGRVIGVNILVETHSLARLSTGKSNLL